MITSFIPICVTLYMQKTMLAKGKSTEHKHGHKCMHEQSMNHISLKKKKNRPRCYAKSSTVQDTFWPIPGWGDREMGTAISCT